MANEVQAAAAAAQKKTPPEVTHRKHCDRLFGAMEQERALIEPHWKLLADNILPRRHRWLLTANELKGGRINTRILDGTATLASRALTSGMQAGMSSPGRPWFRLMIDGFDQSTGNQNHPVLLWLAEVERRMRIVMSKSNFYNALATLYDDLGVFGSGAFIILEDSEDMIRCHNWSVGEFYFMSSDRNAVDIAGRKFTQTVFQLIQWFGYDACPEKVQKNYDDSQWTTEYECRHLIEPNRERRDGCTVAKQFPYRETYWLEGEHVDKDGKEHTLEQRGFWELPGAFARWEVASGEVYGSDCPGMTSLPDVKQLQQETKRKAQGIDKMVNPPMVADIQLENKPQSMIPGGVTYVAGLAQGNTVGFQPAYLVQPRINELMLDIQEVQNRIRQAFFNDLFMMFQQMEKAEPRSAAIVDARREEKMLMLGPVLERLGTEVFDKSIDRIFGIMARANVLPPPPPEIEGMPIRISYISMLAQTQRAAETAAIERSLAMAGNLAGVNPKMLDNYEMDAIPHIYNEALGGNPRIMKDPRKRDKERQERQMAEQAAAATGAAVQGAEAAKLLSETNVGGGRNALQEMIGG